MAGFNRFAHSAGPGQGGCGAAGQRCPGAVGLSGGCAGGCGIVGLASGYEINQEEIQDNNVLGAILGGPGGSWVDLGGSWGGLGGVSGRSWGVSGILGAGHGKTLQK